MNVALGAAFLAGLASIASPCVLPLLPVYLGYLAGDRELGRRGAAASLLLRALAFVAGFSLLFVALGATATALGAFLAARTLLFERLGGAVIVAFGLFLLGLWRPAALNRSAVWRPRPGAGAAGAFVLGLAFAAGWTPCVGPILATILVIAGQLGQAGRGALLLATYSAGLGLPFLAAAAAAGWATARLPRLGPYLVWAERAGGVLLVALGTVMGLGLFGRLVGATG
ncbi:MAG: cytochrome c biogenesis protein CcdA [Firmicutes bacterium]|nr:cytochrome c biogenesis protein CcdA [Bacillota bacterium]